MKASGTAISRLAPNSPGAMSRIACCTMKVT